MRLLTLPLQARPRGAQVTLTEGLPAGAALGLVLEGAADVLELPGRIVGLLGGLARPVAQEDAIVAADVYAHEAES
jgi:hypothetical protein